MILQDTRRKKIKAVYLNLRNRAYGAGIFPGQMAYSKFILLGRGRVGSNFLIRSLNDHPQIKTFGELFRVYNEETQRVEPVDFLETAVYRKQPMNTAAVGFKLFYYHARAEKWKTVWPYLQAEKDVHIIHLKRGNILKTYLSLQKARMTNQWISPSGAERKELPPITLSYEGCLDMFTETREYEQQHDLFFADHPKIEVIYENMFKNYESEMKRIQQFLGVASKEVQPVTQKQAKKSLSQSIANYFELKEAFAQSEWSDFFEE